MGEKQYNFVHIPENKKNGKHFNFVLSILIMGVLETI